MTYTNDTCPKSTKTLIVKSHVSVLGQKKPKRTLAASGHLTNHTRINVRKKDGPCHTDIHTDGQTPGRCFTLTVMGVNSVINK